MAAAPRSLLACLLAAASDYLLEVNDNSSH